MLRGWPGGQHLVSRVRPVPEDRDSGTADGDTRPLPAETGKLDNVAPGHRPWHVHSFASYSPSGTHGQRKHPERPPAPRDTALPRHARLHVQVKRAGRVQARRRGPGAPATRPTSTGQAPEPRAGVLRGETKALNGDPGAWPASHRRSGAEDPLPARSEAPRMGGLGEMLVDPSEQPQLWSAAPGRL